MRTYIAYTHIIVCGLQNTTNDTAAIKIVVWETFVTLEALGLRKINSLDG